MSSLEVVAFIYIFFNVATLFTISVAQRREDATPRQRINIKARKNRD